MNSTRTHLLRGTALAAAMLTSLASQAYDGNAAHERYLRGDTQASTVPAAPELVPGPYARYLVLHNGIALTQALALAEAAGEAPTWAAGDAAAPTQLSSLQVYQRNFGIAPTL